MNTDTETKKLGALKRIALVFLIPICLLGILLEGISCLTGCLADWLKGCLPEDL